MPQPRRPKPVESLGQAAPLRKLRCAVYTRKSSEEGLEQEFNSLDAQREACEAYILSQRAEGWMLVTDRFDDGGVSGGTLERPALKRLLAAIEAGRIDIVVVYKIDRLSRSLTDFSRLVEVFERCKVTFVAVTQSFNTTTSMGRLTLNILLSFAQFEREVIGERIRDKFAASRKRGIWMGGWTPLGFEVRNRKLEIVPAEAALIQRIFRRYAETGSLLAIVDELNREGCRTKRGKAFRLNDVYRVLKNRVYLGEAVHKGKAYPGEHEAIVSAQDWDRAHALMKLRPEKRPNAPSYRPPALLGGLLHGPNGRLMTQSHTEKATRRYRYYLMTNLSETERRSHPLRRVPAGPIEAAVVDQVRALLRSPEIIARTWKAARQKGLALNEGEVRASLIALDPIWDELFPAEQARIVRLLVIRVDLSEGAIRVTLRTEGLTSLLEDLRGGRSQHRDAA